MPIWSYDNWTSDYTTSWNYTTQYTISNSNSALPECTLRKAFEFFNSYTIETEEEKRKKRFSLCNI